MFAVDAKMDEIFVDFFQGKWPQKWLHIDLHWIKNYWYMRFSPKLLKFLQGVFFTKKFSLNSLSLQNSGTESLVRIYWAKLSSQELLIGRSSEFS